jgi:integrase
MVILQGVLERAVEWQRIPANPARAVRKPPQRRERAVRPLAPLKVEQVRAHLLEGARLRDAVLVSVLAYAGLRPGEALALTWSHTRERTILVERAVALGELKTMKTARTRTVRLLAPLAADLLEWRISRGGPADDALLFPGRSGAVWGDDAWRYWHRRIFTPAAKAAGLDSPVRPYDLRHSFVSLLLAEGANVVEIARQAGHSPTMTLSTYAHLFDEAAGAERLSAEDEIRRARQLVRRERRTRSVPEEPNTLPLWPDKEPANPTEPTRGFEPRTPSLRVTVYSGKVAGKGLIQSPRDGLRTRAEPAASPESSTDYSTFRSERTAGDVATGGGLRLALVVLSGKQWLSTGARRFGLEGLWCELRLAEPAPV